MENSVILVGHYGSDRTIAASAWVSTDAEITPEKEERIPQMIHNLWRDKHGTPFEKSLIHFIVRADIATHIHILKHRIGASTNAESARYKEIKEDKFLLPQDWADIPNNLSFANKRQFGSTWLQVLENISGLTNYLYHECLRDLTPVLGRKRAKESARYFKMYNSQIDQDITFNMRSFAHFLSLRHSEHAQLEVRAICNKMIELVLQIEGNPFKETMAAFGYK
jgi:flavin-dependent thymidylate synthase